MALSCGQGHDVNCNDKWLSDPGTSVCEGLCQLSCIFLKLSRVTCPEQVVNSFLIPLLHFFFPLLPSLSQVGPEVLCLVPWRGAGLYPLQCLPFFHRLPGVPRFPSKKELSYLSCSYSCPTGQFHFCSQPGFQAPSPPGTCIPGNPFLPGGRWPFVRDKAVLCSPGPGVPRGPFPPTLNKGQSLQGTCWTQITNSEEHRLPQGRGQDPNGPYFTGTVSLSVKWRGNYDNYFIGLIGRLNEKKWEKEKRKVPSIQSACNKN